VLTYSYAARYEEPYSQRYCTNFELIKDRNYELYIYIRKLDIKLIVNLPTYYWFLLFYGVLEEYNIKSGLCLAIVYCGYCSMQVTY
jgi:hypothetical protein